MMSYYVCGFCFPWNNIRHLAGEFVSSLPFRVLYCPDCNTAMRREDVILCEGI